MRTNFKHNSLYEAPCHNFSQKGEKYDIYYEMHKKTEGYDLDQACIAQMCINGKWRTVAIENDEEWFGPRKYATYCIHSRRAYLSILGEHFPESTPNFIKDRYPMVKNYLGRVFPIEKMSVSSSRHFGTTIDLEGESLIGNKLSHSQEKMIYNLLMYAESLNAEIEEYSKTRFYKAQRIAIRKKRERAEIARGILGTVKIISASFFAGGFSGGDNFSIGDLTFGDLGLNFDGNINSLDSDSKLADYLLSEGNAEDLSQISFTGNEGNMYDERAADFMAEATSHGVDMDIEPERSPDGGLSHVSKVEASLKLDEALEKGEITQTEYKDLKDKLAGA